MKNAQLLIQMEIIYTLDTDLLDAAAAKTTTGTTGNGSHMHTHTYICKCKYVCVCVCGLCRFINILSTWLCFMRNYSSATDCYFRRGLFCVCPKGNFLLPLSFYLTLSPSVALFLIIVFIVFKLSYACKYFSLLHLIVINIFQHFLYLPWHFIAFLHISFICSIM